MNLFLFLLSTKDETSPYQEDRSGTIDLSHSLIPPNTQCKAKHTVKISEGKCECENGYELGDPTLMTGCWTCNNTCGEHMICAYPGVCECIPGFNLYNEKCMYISPEIISITPDTLIGKKRKFLNVSYVAGAEYSHRRGFCKFGNMTTNATIKIQGFARCLIPHQEPGEISFAFSFDNETWSMDELQFNYKKAPSKAIRYIMFAISYIIFFISMYLICSEAKAEVMELYEGDDEEIMNNIPDKNVPIEEKFETT